MAFLLNRTLVTLTGGINVISCENVTESNLDFCCDHTDGCCDSGIGRFQVSSNVDIATIGPSGATISTFTTKTSYALSSVTSTSPPSLSAITTTKTTTANISPSASTESEKPKSLSTGAVAGIAVACTMVGIAALGALVFYKRKSQRPNVAVPERKEPVYTTAPSIIANPTQSQPFEMMALHETELAA